MVLRWSILDIEERKAIIKSKTIQIQTENDGKVWKCLECDYFNKKTTNINDHIEVNHIVTRIFCNICGASFSTMSYLNKHFKHKHQWFPLKSWSFFIDIEEIVSQNITRDSDGNWRCLLCEFQSSWSTNVKQHLESKHLSGIQVKCSFCEKFCPTRHALAMHMRRKHK